MRAHLGGEAIDWAVGRVIAKVIESDPSVAFAGAMAWRRNGGQASNRAGQRRADKRTTKEEPQGR